MDGDESLQQLSALTHHHGTRGTGPARIAETPTPFRFTQDTEEYKLLKKLMKEGSVKPSDRPSDIKDRYEIFAKIPTNSFRSQFNKLKGLLGIATKTGKYMEEGEFLFLLTCPQLIISILI